MPVDKWAQSRLPLKAQLQVQPCYAAAAQTKAHNAEFKDALPQGSPVQIAAAVCAWPNLQLK